jgi:hypothetical protein
MAIPGASSVIPTIETCTDFAGGNHHSMGWLAATIARHERISYIAARLFNAFGFGCGFASRSDGRIQ